VTGKPPLFSREALNALRYGNKNISSARAGKELHNTARPFRETLQYVIAWFQEAGFA
jgi:hypothetical protein